MTILTSETVPKETAKRPDEPEVARLSGPCAGCTEGVAHRRSPRLASVAYALVISSGFTATEPSVIEHTSGRSDRIPSRCATYRPGFRLAMPLPAPNPRPGRPFLETLHSHLAARVPLTTELYVIGCEYVALGIAVGITVREGFGPDQVRHETKEALRRLLWPLSGGGGDGEGWPLGRSVRDRELEVEVSRVRGVREDRRPEALVVGSRPIRLTAFSVEY